MRTQATSTVDGSPASDASRRRYIPTITLGVAALALLIACAPARSGILPTLDQQLSSLISEKLSRNAAQQKIDSQLLLLARPERFYDLPFLATRPNVLPTTIDVIITTVDNLTQSQLSTLLQTLVRLTDHTPIQVGGTIEGIGLQLSDLEVIAALDSVRFIAPVLPPSHNKDNTSQGDKTHRAIDARTSSGLTGAGQKVCVISDGVDNWTQLKTSGDLPNIEVLPGQEGSGHEGTAMLEIVYDLAPGATLGFATSNGGESQFAQNIIQLASPANGRCNIIVDDTDYFTESPFQDGIVANAVNQVTAAGILYFASAGNSYSLESGLSGTWEGDFNASHNVLLVSNQGYLMHEWNGTGTTGNAATSGSKRVYMHWAEPSGKAHVDYDLYVLDEQGKNIVAFSTNMQNGTQDAFEYTEAANQFGPGVRVVVAKPIGTEDRVMNVQWYRGSLTFGTAGATRGHSAAANAISVGATPATGPFPNAFDATAKVELFSSDGPRRVFFDPSGNLLAGVAANNFKSTGGIVRQKPDLTAADGVSTDAFGTFYGTSAAAPHAAAIAALVRQGNPSATAAQIRAKLLAATIANNNGIQVRGAGVLMATLALQPIAALGALDIDGNGKYDALTDGVLLLRWLFGLTGSSLVNGALGQGAQRTDPADITSYLDARRTSLDIDNNGTTDALTDGLMVIRYMFGLRQGAITTNAVANGAQRSSPASIDSYIGSLMP